MLDVFPAAAGKSKKQVSNLMQKLLSSIAMHV